jgi:dTDP-4-amino-4,6-dideoxygalactose transaminase
MSPPVPLCDVNAQYRGLKAELDAAVLRVLQSGQAINGPDVAAFEAEAAAACGVKFAIGCADGTTALLLALAALDIGPGDEVILPPFTFFATVGSVVRLGATPVFADIDPLTYNLDPEEVATKISARTKVILPVHLFGQCAAMGPLQALADANGLRIVEDAAQSFGATYRGQVCGGLSDIGCFSFYPSKNLGTLGDGGMVTTNDAGLAAKLKALRNHGSEVKYFHKYVGWNARLDTIHAAMLRVKLPHVSSWLDGRRAAADRYDALLAGTGLGMPRRDSECTHTFNQYVVRVGDGRRDGLLNHFKANQIGCEVYYPLSLHQQECMKFLGHRTGDFPVSEAAAKDVLALPMFPELTSEQQSRVADVARDYLMQPLRKAA